MFTELLKLRKEAENLDSNGLFKLANVVDNRIKRLSYFLSNLHKFDPSENLLNKLVMAKGLYNRYLKKTGQYGGDDDDFMDRYDEGGPDWTDKSKSKLWDEPEEDDSEDINTDFDKPKKQIGFNRPEGHKQFIDFEQSYLAAILGGTDDKRYFLDLTSAQILNDEGNLSPTAIKENPEAVVIYLIAYPEEQSNPAYREFVKRIKGDFSSISQKQANEILKFTATQSNRQMFPGMCLDLFTQLVLKGIGQDVEDDVINQLTPEFARMELYGRDPEEEAEEDLSDYSMFNGRVAPMHHYMAKQNRASDAQHVLEIYPTQHADRVKEFVSKGDNVGLIGNMIATMISSTKKRKEGEDKKKRISNVPDIQKSLIGGDAYGMHLAKELEKLSAEVGTTARGEPLTDEIVKMALERWNFSSLETSPFSTMRQHESLNKRFAPGDRQAKLVREVIEEEKKKQASDEDYINFFVDNNEEIVVKEILNMGMLPRFVEYQMKLSESSSVAKALRDIVKKREINEKLRADLSSGKKKKVNFQDTSVEENIIQRNFPSLYMLAVDSKQGELGLRDDNSAQVVANNLRRKQVIRDIGEIFSEKGGRQSLNRSAVMESLRIAHLYANPIYESSANQRMEGSEGEGRELGEGIADPKEERERQKRLENFEKTQNEAESQEFDIDSPLFDTRARSLFRYLSESDRKTPQLLGFRKAYHSGIPAEFDKYLKIVKDMMLRYRSKEQRKESKVKSFQTFSQDDIEDTNWKDKIEEEHGKSIDLYTVNEDGTTTVVFDGEEGETVIHSVPRSQEELIQQQNDILEKEDAESSTEGTSYRRLLNLAAQWMRKFDTGSLVELADEIQFNTQDPEGSEKEDFEEREIARTIVMDDEFHELFIEYFESQLSGNKKWAFEEGIAPKPPPGSINLSQRTFRLGRLFAYLHFVCGIGMGQLGVITMQGNGNATHIMKSYLSIVKEYYGKLDGHETDMEDEEIQDAFPVTVTEKVKIDPKTGEEVIKYKNTYEQISKGKEGMRRLTAISNREGIADVDNIVYLASGFFDYANNMKSIFSERNYSERRSKATFLMKIKYMMDAFRLGTAGRADLSTAFSLASRENDTVSSVKSIMGDFTNSTSIAVNAMSNALEDFYESVETLEEGEQVSAQADISLKTIEELRGKFDADFNVRSKGFLEGERVIDDLSYFLRNYEIGGEPIQEITPENSEDIYDRYMSYIESRYGEGSSEFKPNFVNELSKRYITLNSDDRGPVQSVSTQDLQGFSERFYSVYQSVTNKLKEHLRTGKKTLEETDAVKEISDEVKETELVEEVEDQPVISTEPEQPEPVVQPEPVAQPAMVAPQTKQTVMEPYAVIPEDLDQKMLMTRKLGTQYAMTGVPPGSDIEKTLIDLGFQIEPHEGSYSTISAFPSNYREYWSDKIKQMRQTRAISLMNKFVIFSNTELDVILDEYGV